MLSFFLSLYNRNGNKAKLELDSIFSEVILFKATNKDEQRRFFKNTCYKHLITLISYFSFVLGSVAEKTSTVTEEIKRRYVYGSAILLQQPRHSQVFYRWP